MSSPDFLPSAPLLRELTRLGRQPLADRLHAVRALAAARGLQFFDDRSRPCTIDLALQPWVLTPAQLRFFHGLVHELARALMRIPALYVRSAAVRERIPLNPAQESWMRLAGAHAHEALAVMGRMDSTAVYASADWRRSFVFLEPNAVGVGGVHYGPTAGTVVLDALADVLRRAYPSVTVGQLPDPRQLLLDECHRVGQRLRRRVRGLALIENTDFTTGTDEFTALAAWLSARGLPAIVADPRDVAASGGRLRAKGREVDLIYRDCELGEFLDMEASGRRLKGMRRAVRDGRVISGLLWDLDHKSCWDVFTDPQTAKFFSPAHRRLFQRYLPWTRLVRETFTADPAGGRVDLLRYIRAHQPRLVLKPNTLYGGQGVTLGPAVTRAQWERTLHRALRGRERYVVQQLARVHTERFPALDHGRPRWVERSVVSGFFFNSADIGLVGRFSRDPVVNVSRGGGLLAALLAY